MLSRFGEAATRPPASARPQTVAGQDTDNKTHGDDQDDAMEDASVSRSLSTNPPSSSRLSGDRALTDKDSTAKPPRELMNLRLVRAISPRLWTGWWQAWTSAKKVEQTAFLQLASLEQRTLFDQEWMRRIAHSKQRSYKKLITIFLHAVGSIGLCQVCEGRAPLRHRNCRALPPAARDMKELQSIVGRQCTNCYLASTLSPCEFSAATEGHRAPAPKQTPVPLPVSTLVRPFRPNNEQTHEQPRDASLGRPSDSASRYASEGVQARGDAKETPGEEGRCPQTSTTRTDIPPLPVSSPHVLPSGISDQAEARAAMPTHPRKPLIESTRRFARLTNGSADSPGHSHDSGVESLGADSSSTLGHADASNATAHSEPFDALRSHSNTSVPVSGRTISSSNHPLVTSTIAKAFTLFGEIGQLPIESQAGVYQKIAELSALARRPLDDDAFFFPPSQSVTVFEEWEIAPGCLSAPRTRPAAANMVAPGVAPVGFSSSFLRREVVAFELAYQVSRSQRILNKHLPCLGVTRIENVADGWECTMTVLEGFVKVKTDAIDARMAQGGVLIIVSGSYCTITNVMDKESKIQVRWVRIE